MVKPFLPQELLLRTENILKRYYRRGRSCFPHRRRGNRPAAGGGAPRRHRFSAFTAKEHDILAALCRNAGRIVSIDQLCEAAWGDNPYGYDEFSDGSHPQNPGKNRRKSVKAGDTDHRQGTGLPADSAGTERGRKRTESRKYRKCREKRNGRKGRNGGNGRERRRRPMKSTLKLIRRFVLILLLSVTVLLALKCDPGHHRHLSGGEKRQRMGRRAECERVSDGNRGRRFCPVGGRG